MEIVNGNILNIHTGILCHQVNAQGKMGAGLALAIRNKWPVAYTDYLRARLRLGQTAFSKISDRMFVAHMCGQNKYWPRGQVHTNYDALAQCMITVVGFYQKNRPALAQDQEFAWKIYLPYGIGCGLAGGDWKIVSEMIKNIIDKDAVIVKKE